jgi:hypothetical protein
VIKGRRGRRKGDRGEEGKVIEGRRKGDGEGGEVMEREE